MTAPSRPRTAGSCSTTCCTSPTRSAGRASCSELASSRSAPACHSDSGATPPVADAGGGRVVSCQVRAATSGTPARRRARATSAARGCCPRTRRRPRRRGRQGRRRPVRHDGHRCVRPREAVRGHPAEHRPDEALGQRRLPVPPEHEGVGGGGGADEDRSRVALGRADPDLDRRGAGRPAGHRPLDLLGHRGAGRLGQLRGRVRDHELARQRPQVHAWTTSIREPRRAALSSAQSSVVSDAGEQSTPTTTSRFATGPPAVVWARRSGRGHSVPPSRRLDQRRRSRPAARLQLVPLPTTARRRAQGLAVPADTWSTLGHTVQAGDGHDAGHDPVVRPGGPQRAGREALRPGPRARRRPRGPRRRRPAGGQRAVHERRPARPHTVRGDGRGVGGGRLRPGLGRRPGAARASRQRHRVDHRPWPRAAGGGRRRPAGCWRWGRPRWSGSAWARPGPTLRRRCCSTGGASGRRTWPGSRRRPSRSCSAACRGRCGWPRGSTTTPSCASTPSTSRPSGRCTGRCRRRWWPPTGPAAWCWRRCGPRRAVRAST